MKPVQFHPEARAELDEAAEWYNRKRDGLGAELLSAVERAVDRIAKDPQMGAPYKSTHLRFSLVKRFPYVVYYLDRTDDIWIAAVAHGRQRPDYWKSRIPT